MKTGVQQLDVTHTIRTNITLIHHVERCLNSPDTVMTPVCCSEIIRLNLIWIIPAKGLMRAFLFFIPHLFPGHITDIVHQDVFAANCPHPRVSL